MPHTSERYLTLNHHLRKKFGCRVQKITIKYGFTCPNRNGNKGDDGCIYCSHQELYPANFNSKHSLMEQLDQGLPRLKKRFKTNKFIAYFQDHTATYAPVELLADIFNQPISRPEIVGLAVGTRPDCLPEPVMELLADLASKTYLWLEIGLQSADDLTLARINRQHSVLDFIQAVKRCKKLSIPVVAHVILGLPGETRANWLKTAKLIADLQLDGVKIHNIYIPPNTELARQYRNGDFKPLEIEEYLDGVMAFLERLPFSTVIHRLVGEGGKNSLAPDWCLDKREVLTRLHQKMERCHSRQGMKI